MRQSYTKLFYLSFSVDPLTTELTVPANRFSDLAKYKARTSARAPSLAATALEIWLSACVKYWSDRGLVLSVSLDFIVFFLSTHYGFFLLFLMPSHSEGWRVEGGGKGKRTKFTVTVWGKVECNVYKQLTENSSSEILI